MLQILNGPTVWIKLLYVMPAKAGIHRQASAELMLFMDSRLRGNDKKTVKQRLTKNSKEL